MAQNNPEGALAKLAKFIGVCVAIETQIELMIGPLVDLEKFVFPIANCICFLLSIPIAGAPVGLKLKSFSCHTAPKCAGGNQKLLRI